MPLFDYPVFQRLHQVQVSEWGVKKRLRLSGTLLGLTEVGKVLVDARFCEYLLLLALPSGICSYRHFLLAYLLL